MKYKCSMCGLSFDDDPTVPAYGCLRCGSHDYKHDELGEIKDQLSNLEEAIRRLSKTENHRRSIIENGKIYPQLKISLKISLDVNSFKIKY